MDKTVLIEQTSKRLKRWELIVTAMLFLTLFAHINVSMHIARKYIIFLEKYYQNPYMQSGIGIVLVVQLLVHLKKKDCIPVSIVNILVVLMNIWNWNVLTMTDLN